MCACVCLSLWSGGGRRALTFPPATMTLSAVFTTFLKKSSSFSFLFFPRTLSWNHTHTRTHDEHQLSRVAKRKTQSGAQQTAEELHTALEGVSGDWRWGKGRGHVTHILVVFQEDVEVEVFPEDRVGSDAAQEDLVHGHGLLEDGQVLASTEESRKGEEGGGVKLQ